MRILLVRHGESEGNADPKVHLKKADHALDLTPAGRGHASNAGKFLAKYLGSDPPGREPRMWVSPYTRTRQTADEIEKMAPGCFHDRREHVLLIEQQFGLFDGLSNEECTAMYPAEDAYYRKQKEFEGKFFAQMPLGESRLQVAQRVHQAFGTFHRDASKHNIEDIIIIAHGTVIRCFVMMWCHKPYEWIEKEPNPKNCSIRLLDDGEDKGYIYEGER